MVCGLIHMPYLHGHTGKESDLTNQNHAISLIKLGINLMAIKFRARDPDNYSPPKRQTSPAIVVRQLQAFLRKHPFCTARELQKAGYSSHLQSCFSNRLNEAKRTLLGRSVGYGKTDPGRRYKKQNESRKLLLMFLKENPRAGIKEISEAGLKKALGVAYDSRLTQARRDAGVIQSHWILASQKARQLGISRQRISELIKKKQLPAKKIGRNTFVPRSAKIEYRIRSLKKHPKGPP